MGSPLVCKLKQYDHPVVAGIAMHQDFVDAENNVNPIIYTKISPFLHLFREMVDKMKEDGNLGKWHVRNVGNHCKSQFLSLIFSLMFNQSNKS